MLSILQGSLDGILFRCSWLWNLDRLRLTRKYILIQPIWSSETTLVPHVSCLCVLVPILSCPHFPLCLCLSLCLFILSKSITIVSIHDFTFTLPLDPEADSGHKAEGLELPCRKYYNLSSGAFLFSVKIGLSSTLP